MQKKNFTNILNTSSKVRYTVIYVIFVCFTKWSCMLASLLHFLDLCHLSFKLPHYVLHPSSLFLHHFHHPPLVTLVLHSFLSLSCLFLSGLCHLTPPLSSICLHLLVLLTTPQYLSLLKRLDISTLLLSFLLFTLIRTGLYHILWLTQVTM